jgi:NitT/TauT family transport system substrate-binding protein
MEEAMTRRELARTLHRVLAVAGAVIAALSTNLSLSDRALAQTKASLLLDWTWWPPHMGVTYAQVKGFYKEAGLDLELRQGNGSGSTVAAVAQGTYDFGIADIPVTAQAITRGANVKVVATLTQKNGIGVVYVKSAGIKVPKDIEGKRFGSSPTGFDAQLYPAFFNANKIDPSKVEIVNLPGDAKLTALLAGKTDIVSGNAFYYAALARSKGADVGEFVYSDYGVPLLGYAIIANGNVLRAKPDLVREIVASTVRGYEHAFKDIDGAVSSYLAVSGLNEDRTLIASIIRDFGKLVESANTKGQKLGWNSEANWQSTLTTLHEYADMPGGKKLQDFYTNDFVAQ